MVGTIIAGVFITNMGFSLYKCDFVWGECVVCVCIFVWLVLFIWLFFCVIYMVNYLVCNGAI